MVTNVTSCSNGSSSARGQNHAPGKPAANHFGGGHTKHLLETILSSNSGSEEKSALSVHESAADPEGEWCLLNHVFDTVVLLTSFFR